MNEMRKCLCYSVPMKDCTAQIVMPRDLSREEAERLGAFPGTLAVPWNAGPIPVGLAVTEPADD